MNLTIDETQIITEIPTEIPVAVKGDGTFSVPQNVHIRNHSVFAVHVPKVKVTVNGQPQFALVSKDDFKAGDDERTLWTTVKAGTHELDLSTAAGDDGVDTQKGQWNMARHDKNNETGPDKLHLTFDGAIKNASGLMSDAALTAVTVQWTLAAGEPADVPAGS